MVKLTGFTLIDDGTLDTVFVCDRCGEEIRTNPEPEDDKDSEGYERVDMGREIAAATHNCPIH